MNKTRALIDRIKGKDITGVMAGLAAGTPIDGSRWWWLMERYGPTPLHAAVHVQSLEIVTLLLDHGANPDIDRATWPRPLCVACQQGNRQIVELLLARGADLHSKGSRNGTPLEYATWYCKDELVELLLARGADPQPVMARGTGSLLRTTMPILRRLVDAGGKPPAEIVEWMAEAERRIGTISELSDDLET